MGLWPKQLKTFSTMIQSGAGPLSTTSMQELDTTELPMERSLAMLLSQRIMRTYCSTSLWMPPWDPRTGTLLLLTVLLKPWRLPRQGLTLMSQPRVSSLLITDPSVEPSTGLVMRAGTLKLVVAVRTIPVTNRLRKPGKWLSSRHSSRCARPTLVDHQMSLLLMIKKMTMMRPAWPGCGGSWES